LPRPAYKAENRIQPVSHNVLFKKFFLILIFTLTVPIHPTETVFTYDGLLDQANRNILELRFEKAKEKLALAASIQKPDYKFYYLMGEAFIGLNYSEEALSEFKKSLELNPNQPGVFLRCSEIAANLKKPKEAFSFLQEYLKFHPNDKKELYKMLVLSSRLGIDEKRKFLLKKLKSENQYIYDLDAILTLIKKLISEKKIPQALAELDKYLPNFPDNESLHKLILIATKTKNPHNIEKILIDSAAIFKYNPKYSVDYGLFLLEKNKLFEALSTFRRAFLVSLMTSGFNADEEILYFIRQVYFEMGRLQDATATRDLIEKMRNKENQSPEDLKSLISLHNNNREIIVYTLFYLSEKGLKKEYEETSELLQFRDKLMQDKEFIDILGAFSYENLSLEKERPLE